MKKKEEKKSIFVNWAKLIGFVIGCLLVMFWVVGRIIKSQ